MDVSYTGEDTAKATRYAIALMAGNASKWIDCLEIKDNLPKSFPDFQKAFLAYFLPLDNAQAARDKLRMLTQTGGVQQYITQFEECILVLPDMSKADQAHGFIYGLKPETRRFFKAHSQAFGELSLDKVMTLALQLEGDCMQGGRQDRGNNRKKKCQFNRNGNGNGSSS